MAYSDILYEVSGAVARITLNRPEKRNPIGPGTIGELLHALDAAKKNSTVRVVVITGAGKVFSAGGDLSAFLSSEKGSRPLQAGEGADSIAGSYVDLNLALTRLGKPSIAMVNGHALAGGLGIVLACDLAIASADAQFGAPEINVGLWPMMIMSTIFRNVTRKRGLELILTGDRVSAEEAARIGLITRAVPAEKLSDEVDSLAAKLAAKSPAVMRMGLEAFYALQDVEFEPALRELESRLGQVLSTDDAREGLTAFLEKRAPNWTGQ